MKLLIFYLTNSQRHYTFHHFIKLLSLSTKKSQWKLLILPNDETEDFYNKEMEEFFDINYDIYSIMGETPINYLLKAEYAVNYANYNNIPYMMKCDNDIFLKADVIDYIIDNLNILENNKHLTISPVLSTGIPSVEYFKDQFMDKESQEKLNNMFSNTYFPFIGSVNYSPLNKYTVDNSTKIWDPNSFFKGVKEFNHYYKGIHPIRVKEENMLFINNYIINNKDRFLQPSVNMELIIDNNSPYLCNSVFCIKTDVYKTILSSENMYVDNFDEVPLNKYAWLNNKNHVFIKNGFAIHMYYNWISNYLDYEKEFCKKFFTN